ncbi:MAG TPA: choice-of-anchor Q domain-containing protein, partial [Saprospiraceae bacterium]|nr:choice-of-anchor Q domain-containing protein [Saprospiraceae bacterium]
MMSTCLQTTRWLLNAIGVLLATMYGTATIQAQTTRTVCAGGCDHPTIAAAVAASASGDIIHVNTALHTENGITITNKNLTIKGNGISATTVQGAASRASAANRIFTIVGSSAITIEDIKIQHGYGNASNAYGGAFSIDNVTGNFSANRVHFYRNDGFPVLNSNNGGAIYGLVTAGQTITFDNCVFEDNRALAATGGARGGAIAFGSGGGGSVILTNSIFLNNSTTGGGGAVAMLSSTVAWTIRDCTFEGNSATTSANIPAQGGAISFSGGVTGGVTGCLFNNNSSASVGGAIRMGSAGANTNPNVLTNCTFVGNTAVDGGAVWRQMGGNSLVTRIVNCTFSGNSASGNGSGLYLNPADASATTQIVNTIFNHPSKDIYVAATTGNFNNSTKNYGNSSTGVAGAPTLAFDYNSGNSTLGLSGTLANNGGPTQTLELLPASTLANVGANTATGANVPIKDQRNYSRTDTGIDLGAYERGGIQDDATAPSITYTALTSTMSTSDRTLTATITDVNGGYGFAALAQDLRPRIYFRKNAGAWQSAAGTLASGTGRNGSWNFTISAAAMGGLANGDQVCYYVVAQDVSTVVNIASNPSGATATSVNNITTAPTPNCYNIGSAPSCPTFSGAPANVTITNSTCASACTLSGGSITAPGSTPCPTGSTLQYQVNSGSWSSTLPIYDQDGPAQSIKTRCACDIDANMTSPESATAVTIPGICVTPTISGLSSVAVNAMITLTGSGTPAGSMPYTSNNTGVATVNSSGVVTGVSEGMATITYTNASGCTATKVVTVTPAAPVCPTFSSAPANVSITNSTC